LLRLQSTANTMLKSFLISGQFYWYYTFFILTIL